MNRIKIRPGVRLQIAAKNGYKCSVCDKTLGPVFHIDHIVALCNGGDNSLANLQAVCPNCHAAKTAIDTQCFWDKQTEIRTGVSRFFNPMAYEYLAPARPRPRYAL